MALINYLLSGSDLPTEMENAGFLLEETRRNSNYLPPTFNNDLNVDSRNRHSTMI